MTSTAPTVRLEGTRLVFAGDWALPNVPPALPASEALSEIDLTAVSDWDSNLVSALWKLQKAAGKPIPMTGAPENIQKLLSLSLVTSGQPHSKFHLDSRRYKAAMWLHHAQFAVTDAVTFLGEIIIRIGAMTKTRQHMRPNDWLIELEEAGWRALPIVLFISFLIGLMLAYVGSIQLEMFGANVYVANLVGLAMTREMGALITGIVMAGRTGSAYAAKIGSMKRAEELDALKTMGLSPIDMVVLPRVAALTLMLPLLAVFSTFMGMFGGMIVGNTVLDVSVPRYIQATAEAVPVKHFFIGISKAVIFGFLIAFASAWRGMRCGNTADAVGEAATSAVVLSITLIIVANTACTMILNALRL